MLRQFGLIFVVDMAACLDDGKIGVMVTNSDDFEERREALPDNGSIAEFGGCVWTYWDGGVGRDQVRSELDKWGDADEDQVAIAHLEKLIERAEKGGLMRANFSAPCGAKTGRRLSPWIGELKSLAMRTRGTEGARDYRLYFAEVPLGGPNLLAAKLGWKCTKWDEADAKEKQTLHIGNAMGIAKAHARDLGGSYREKDWSL